MRLPAAADQARALRGAPPAFRRIFFACLLFSFAAPTANAQACPSGVSSWTSSTPIAANITYPGGAASARFGAALAVSPDSATLYVGAPGANLVFLFTTATCGGAWANSSVAAGGPLTGSDTVAGDGFGSAVAASPDGVTLFVGAPSRGGGGGGIYVFALVGGAWAQAGAPLTSYPGLPPSSQVGGAMAVSPDGSTLYASAPGCSTSVTCGASVFIAWKRSGGAWQASPNASISSLCMTFQAPAAVAFYPDGNGIAVADINLNLQNKLGVFTAVRDEGGWAWGAPMYGGTAVAVAPFGSTVIFGNSVQHVVSVCPGAMPGGAWPACALLSIADSPFYVAPTAADGYGSALAVAPTGGFTAVGAPLAAGSGAVLIYLANSTAATPTATPTTTQTPAIAPSPTVAAVPCNGNLTYKYSGAFQYYVVPAGVTWLSVFMWGAGGYLAGGAYVQGNLSVTPGETLRIIVGAGCPGWPYTQVGGTAGGSCGNFGECPPGGGRSAVQRVYDQATATALTALWGTAAATLRGLTGGFFTDIVTAAGGGTWVSAGSATLVGQTSPAGFAQSDACGNCLSMYNIPGTGPSPLAGCPAIPTYFSSAAGSGGGWCGGPNFAGYSGSFNGGGGTSWTLSLNNAFGLSGTGTTAHINSTFSPWYPGNNVGDSCTSGAVVIVPLSALE